MIFFLMLPLRCKEADMVGCNCYIAIVVVLAITFRQWCCYWQLIIAAVVDTGKKIIAGVMVSMKIQDKAKSPVSLTLVINLLLVEMMRVIFYCWCG
jgi:hypothetical protein